MNTAEMRLRIGTSIQAARMYVKLQQVDGKPLTAKQCKHLREAANHAQRAICALYHAEAVQ
jgi:hypothetical protein